MAADNHPFPDIYPEALNTMGAAEHLGVNFFTFRTSYRGYKIPHQRMGGVLVFFPSDLDAWRVANPTAMRGREAA